MCGAGINRIGPIEPIEPQGGALDVIARQRLALVGAWKVPDPGGVPALFTFNSDGTLLESDVDHTFTAGHGVWYHLGGTQFAYTFIQHKKDDQDQVGSVVVYGTVTIDRSGNSFTGPLHFEFKDTTGKVDTDASLGLDIKTDGTRIQLRQ